MSCSYMIDPEIDASLRAAVNNYPWEDPVFEHSDPPLDKRITEIANEVFRSMISCRQVASKRKSAFANETNSSVWAYQWSVQMDMTVKNQRAEKRCPSTLELIKMSTPLSHSLLKQVYFQLFAISGSHQHNLKDQTLLFGIKHVLNLAAELVEEKLIAALGLQSANLETLKQLKETQDTLNRWKVREEHLPYLEEVGNRISLIEEALLAEHLKHHLSINNPNAME